MASVMCVHIMSGNRGIGVYNYSLWASSNLSYLEKYIKRRRPKGCTLHRLKATLKSDFSKAGLLCQFSAVFVSKLMEAYCSICSIKTYKDYYRKSIEMDRKREADRQKANSLRCLWAVCETRPSAHSLSQPWFHYCAVWQQELVVLVYVISDVPFGLWQPQN